MTIERFFEDLQKAHGEKQFKMLGNFELRENSVHCGPKGLRGRLLLFRLSKLPKKVIRSVQEDDRSRGVERAKQILGLTDVKKEREEHRALQNRVHKRIEEIVGRKLPSDFLEPGGEKRVGFLHWIYPWLYNVNSTEKLRNFIYSHMFSSSLVEDISVLHDLAIKNDLLIDMNPRLIKEKGKEKIKFVIERLEHPED